MLNDRQQMALAFIEMIEGLIGQVAVREAALKLMVPEEEDWKEWVERMEILAAPKVHVLFAPLRELARGNPDENQIPGDLNSVVRRLLDSVRELPNLD